MNMNLFFSKGLKAVCLAGMTVSVLITLFFGIYACKTTNILFGITLTSVALIFVPVVWFLIGTLAEISINLNMIRAGIYDEKPEVDLEVQNRKLIKKKKLEEELKKLNEEIDVSEDKE